MKTIKLIMALIAILLFSNVVFGVKPLTGDAKHFAKIKVKQLDKMITLTDSQKVLVEKKALEFGQKILDRDSVTYQAFSQQYKQEYKIAIDSILTSEQKSQLAQKQLQRSKDIIALINKKNKK